MATNSTPITRNETILANTRAHVRQLLEGEGSGHDWWHIDRVVKLALNLGEQAGADLYTVELAALLHDIGDHKFHNGDHTVGPRMVREWLEGQQEGAGVTDHIVAIVEGISYKGAGVDTSMPTLEGRVVQDADRLDAIGAIGVARTFAYGGHKGQPMHDPRMEPKAHADFETYKHSEGTTVNHFYEKLLLLKDRMQTPEGQQMAEERHRFMEQFLDVFYKEWEGKA